ncbi:MAG: class I SAM-dependent methyltransferase [Azoarcus sp.]|jgi:predicted O-methyltransferase YrrM|nr:class I SAM-dependent methyltransferase [Azoarcus sp.]
MTHDDCAADGTAVLVFPAGMPKALAYLARAREEGRRVIGSSSLGYDPARANYPEWVSLPYVTAPDFVDEMSRAIDELKIDTVFTPNPVVWNYLNRWLREAFAQVDLEPATPPVENDAAPYRRAKDFAASLCADPLPVAARSLPISMVSALEIAALFHHSENIPGSCDHQKIRALCEIFRYAPEGDMVEIGCLFGKSAFVLSRLAGLYARGALLCVDPWSSEFLPQKTEWVDSTSSQRDFEEVLTAFQINLLPYAQGTVNYLRLPSLEAAQVYRRGTVVETAEFGETRYSGHIAVLHIDGNHEYENVRNDMAAWAELVQPGGWIVVDDYKWPYGDGPRRAADEFLQRRQCQCAFFTGGALFIQT